MTPRWRIGAVSRHRSYIALVVPARARAARVAVVGDVWDQPRTIAVELVVARELDATTGAAAHATVRAQLDAVVPALAGPDPWAVALMTKLPFVGLEPEVVWSPFDLSPEGQRRLHARLAAHERWRRAAL
ncbi:MAG: hypothetical protein JNK64_12930 [Myxococcales bacterium]|nr:hypothetical protein [Myxococcales bacterium]